MNPVQVRQSGYVLITAVFLITAVAAVAVVSALMLSARAGDTVRGLEAARAYYAARAGIELAAARALAADCAAVPASTVIEDFDVTLVCVPTTVTEGDETFRVFTLHATAQRGRIEAGTLVQREVRASLQGEAL